MATAWLSLGSNLEPEKHLRAALLELRTMFGDLVVSPAYRSKAVGFDGPAFINLAVSLTTDLDAISLNDALHAIEDRHGRRRDVPRFSSRTLDIDIVLYDDLVLDGPGHLKIPRDELRHAFVLRPLADIAGDVVHPLTGQTLSQMQARVPDSGELEVVRL
ncbi:2-amino-4-hydroxy-6-hydroxymethyldihydropteridine diphosphokinase [Pinirhizobacter sp.]|jgi:2-amino-4-hydroxy-6-hydroxymethyldihydropteridine diphosphokinase|uniref:2-amino-4-hydroxy-6- hydroxymethyldihydropteridine diphosphokinase n=1 Tax=Pinirhizobacter sp. TaxID=2950432 RepID=UPI002F3FA00F